MYLHQARKVTGHVYVYRDINLSFLYWILKLFVRYLFVCFFILLIYIFMYIFFCTLKLSLISN